MNFRRYLFVNFSTRNKDLHYHYPESLDIGLSENSSLEHVISLLPQTVFPFIKHLLNKISFYRSDKRLFSILKHALFMSYFWAPSLLSKREQFGHWKAQVQVFGLHTPLRIRQEFEVKDMRNKSLYYKLLSQISNWNLSSPSTVYWHRLRAFFVNICFADWPIVIFLRL